MNTKDRPQDSDPSDMTDFEKNATLGELERLVPGPEPDSDPERTRQHEGNTGPDEEPGFGQGA